MRNHFIILSKKKENLEKTKEILGSAKVTKTTV